MKKNLCIVGSLYGLFVYLIYSSQRDIENTKFIIDAEIKPFVSKITSDYYVVSESRLFYFSIFRILYYRLIFHYYIFNTNHNYTIYAQDHTCYASYILGDKEYTMIEDAPHIAKLFASYKNYFKNKLTYSKRRASFTGRMIGLLHGQAYKLPHGLSPTAKRLLLSADDHLQYTKGKDVVLFDFEEKWNTKREDERSLILETFGLSANDVDIIKSKRVIIYTQPLFDRKYCTLEEHARIYKQIIENYHECDVMIKVHPQDTFDYSSICNQAYIFKKKVPSQLIDVIGARFEIAATVCSSAVYSLTYPVKIEFYGTEISDQLVKSMGIVKEA